MDGKKKGILTFFAGFGIGMLCMALILGLAYLALRGKQQETVMEWQQTAGQRETEIPGQESRQTGEETVPGETEGNGTDQAEKHPEEGTESLTAAGEDTADKVSPNEGADAAADTGDYTLWTAEGVYTGGNEVYFEGGIFKARWWTQGEEPKRDGDSVWEYLGELPQGGLPGNSAPETDYDTSSDVKRDIKEGEFKVVAYYPSWKEGQANLDKLRFDIVTHVNYAFAIPTAEGGLKPLENPGLAKAVIEKAHQSGAKALIAVGGWSYNDTPLEPTFVEATSTDDKIAKFGDAILQLCDDYGFDGVDMDWEHPRVDGGSSGQYEKLMVYLAERLHKENKILTSAVLSGVTADGLVYYDAPAHTDTVLNTVDWINVMAYDGGDGDRHSTYEFAVNCGEYWHKTRKMDASKVVLGVPFYGRPSWASYEDFLKSDSKAADQDVINYNGMEAHYNGMPTIGKKTDYALQNLGGIMIWEITQDTTGQDKSLLTAIGDRIAAAAD